jgi:Tol biopolymer transport system component
LCSRADWSPDGSKIAFTGTQPGEREHLFLVSSAAGAPQEVATGNLNVRYGGWTPDGNSILLSDAGFPDHGSIRFLDLKTMKLTTLPDSRWRIGAALSPDGHYVAATTVDGQKLLIFDVAAQTWSELTQTSVNAIRWSLDSKLVYFDTQSSTEPAIYRLHVADRKVESVASLKNLHRVAMPFVSWIGLTPDGFPLLMRDTGTQEVYALDFETP